MPVWLKRTCYKEKMKTLMILNFQLFSKSENLTAQKAGIIKWLQQFPIGKPFTHDFCNHFIVLLLYN
jgi:hypothetical protein